MGTKYQQNFDQNSDMKEKTASNYYEWNQECLRKIMNYEGLNNFLGKFSLVAIAA